MPRFGDLFRKLFGKKQPALPAHKGEVADFLAGEYTTVHSSNVFAAQYHARDKKLMVEYTNSRAYLYSPVSEATAVAFITASSKGAFVWDHFRVRGPGGDARAAPGITVTRIR